MITTKDGKIINPCQKVWILFSLPIELNSLNLATLVFLLAGSYSKTFSLIASKHPPTSETLEGPSGLVPSQRGRGRSSRPAQPRVEAGRGRGRVCDMLGTPSRAHHPPLLALVLPAVYRGPQEERHASGSKVSTLSSAAPAWSEEAVRAGVADPDETTPRVWSVALQVTAKNLPYVVGRG